MILLIVILGGSLIGLLISADLVIRGSVALAVRAHVPPLLIGLTIVAFGTSAPELVISAQAAWNGVGGIALGNVVGSNIANVLLVLGVPALIYPISADQPAVRRNTIMMLGASILMVAMCLKGVVVFNDGLILFTLILAFLVYSGFQGLSGKKDDPTLEELTDLEAVGGLPQPLHKIIGLLVLGLIGLPLASHFLVESSSELARSVGVSDSVIGLSLVALGTSLPELATAVAAARHRQSAVAIGNVIGSNLFNILAVMGVAAMIADIEVPDIFIKLNLWIMLASAFLLLPFVLIRSRVTRLWGALFTTAYVLFIIINFV